MDPLYPHLPGNAPYVTHPPACGSSVAHYFRQVAISRRRQSRWIDRSWRRNRTLATPSPWKR